MLSTSVGMLTSFMCVLQLSSPINHVTPIVLAVRTDDHHASVPRTNYILGPSMCVDTWLVAELQETDGTWTIGAGGNGVFGPIRKDPRRNGLLSLRLSDGMASELLLPRSESPDKENVISHHYLTGDKRCIVVITTYERSKNEWSWCASYAWEWSLETNTLRPFGRWTYADMLAPILNNDLITVEAGARQAGDRVPVTLSQIHGTKSVSVSLRFPAYLACETTFERDGETIVPQKDRRSVVTFKSGDTEEQESPADGFALDCIDPGGQLGHRWIIRAKDILDWTGVSPTSVLPARGLDGKSGTLALAVQGTNADRQQRDVLVLIDEATGKPTRVVVLARTLSSDRILRPLLTGDATKAVYLELEDYGSAYEKKLHKQNCTLDVIDTQTSRMLLSADVSKCCWSGDIIIKYDVAAARVLTADSEQIGWLSARSPHERHAVFRLNGRDRARHE